MYQIKETFLIRFYENCNKMKNKNITKYIYFKQDFNNKQNKDLDNQDLIFKNKNSLSSAF